MVGKLISDEQRNNDGRRALSERRDAPCAIETDNRSSGDRRSERDRRSETHGIEFETRKTLSEMEQYLDGICGDFWSAVLLDIIDDSLTSRYRLQFFSLTDRDRVINDMANARTH